MKFALEEYGVARSQGVPNTTPRVVEYLSGVGLGDRPRGDEYAWCAAFVRFCLMKAGILEKPQSPSFARSWLSFGNVSLAQPVFGAICVLSRGLNVRQGHVGFCVGGGEGTIFVLGGNQTRLYGSQKMHSSVCIKKYGRSRLLGLRWPPDLPVPSETSLRLPQHLMPFVQE